MNTQHNPAYRKGGLLARVRPDLLDRLPKRPEPAPAIEQRTPVWIERLASNAKVLAGMSVTAQLYRAARLSADARALSSGDPRRQRERLAAAAMTPQRRCATGGCVRIPREHFATCDACTARLTAYAFGPTRQMNRVERLFVEPRETAP